MEVWLRRRRRRFRFSDFRFEAAAATLSGTGSASPRPERNSWLRGALTLFLTLTRARALMARQWSARCYGVARQRDGSRQNSIPSGVLSLRHFSGWFSLSLGAWVPKNLARRRMASAGAMLLDRLGPPGFRFTDFRAPR